MPGLHDLEQSGDALRGAGAAHEPNCGLAVTVETREPTVAACDAIERAGRERAEDDVGDAVPRADAARRVAPLAGVVDQRGDEDVRVIFAFGAQLAMDVEAVALVGRLHRGEERVQVAAEDGLRLTQVVVGDPGREGASELASAI